MGLYTIIEKDCVIEDDVVIGNYVYIMEGCVIGSGTKIEHFVLLKPHTIIGEDCFIDSYFKSSGHNVIGNRVTMRFNATLCREAIVEDDVFVSPNVMTIYKTYTGEKKGGIRIGKGCHIGTNAVINAGVEMVPGVVIGAMSFVAEHCTVPGIYTGIPAKLRSG